MPPQQQNEKAPWDDAPAPGTIGYQEEKAPWEEGFAGISVLKAPPTPKFPITPKPGEDPGETMRRAALTVQANPEASQKAESESERRARKEAIPAAAATAATMALGPQAGVLARAGMAGLGAAGGEAGYEIGQELSGSPYAPQSSEEAATRIGETGAGYGAAEAGIGLLGKAGEYGLRAYLRHLDPQQRGVGLIFRGLNPSSSMSTARQDIIEAADDLVNIYDGIEKRLSSPEVKGGVINQDLRLREFKNAISDYKSDMYLNERAAQIAAGSARGSRVTVTGNPNELQHIGRFLSKQLPLDSPQLRAAQKLAANPLQSIPIEEADALATAVNSMDLKTAWEGAASRTLSARRTLDQGLIEGLDNELHNIGQPGIRDYERRYAALSRIEEMAESAKTPAEKRLWLERVHTFLSLHGANLRSHVGAFESPGGMVEEGLGLLRKAGRGGPSRSQALPQTIHQGQVVPPTPPQTGLGPATPVAGPPPPGAGPARININPQQYLAPPPTPRLPAAAERRVADVPVTTERRAPAIEEYEKLKSKETPAYEDFRKRQAQRTAGAEKVKESPVPESELSGENLDRIAQTKHGKKFNDLTTDEQQAIFREVKSRKKTPLKKPPKPDEGPEGF